MDINHLSTPTLILDKARLQRNIDAMAERVKALGVDLRPHLKTTKSADVARLAVDGNFGGITVATMREAEYFLENGITDITYAVCIVPSKLDQALSLVDRGADLKLLTDNADVAGAIAGHGGLFKVLIEIDCGEHRTGVLPDSPELLEIAGILAAGEKTELAGVLTHAGHTYACRSKDEIIVVAEDERAAAVLAADRIREAGHPCPTVSTGSTPSVMFARNTDGVTEVRPGVYMLGDMFQVGIGTRSIDEVALTVLTSVIAHRRDDNQLYIDAGGLALSKDRATAAFKGDDDVGYGLVCDLKTTKPIAGLRVASVHQEHGLVTGDRPLPFDDLPVGSKVRIMPNHVCMTAAAYDSYNVIDGDGGFGEVTAVWGRCNGW
ncbi:MAG: alanine racemase [Rhodospirillales bacterium]|nr:alanine racemase [Rhodospirillales bacterium]